VCGAGGDSRPRSGKDGRPSLRSLRVAGIYEIEDYGSLAETFFPSLLRSNYATLSYDTPVLGIRDSVMVLSSSVDSTQLIPQTGFFSVHITRTGGTRRLATQ
jgi:hypothetical protein